MKDNKTRDPSALRSEVVLQLAWVTNVDADQIRLGAVAFLDALGHLGTPLDLSFRLVAKGGELQAALVVGGLEPESTRIAARQVLALIEACVPWYGFQTVNDAGTARFALDPTPEWASLVTVGPHESPRVRMGSASALARRLAGSDVVVSVALGVSMVDDEPVRCSDILVISSSQPTETVGALASLELGERVSIGVAHGRGRRASELVAKHGACLVGLTDKALAEFISLPVRADSRAAWTCLPMVPAGSDRLVEVLRSAPAMHRWIVGRTGTGKSTLMEHLIVADAAEGKSILVVDPHGELVRRLVDLLPPERAEDVDYLDFVGPTPPRYDLMLPEPGQDSERVVGELVLLLRDLFEDSPEDWFGPVYYQTMRWALRLVIRGSKQPSLRQVVRVLEGDPDVVHSLLGEAGDEELEGMWTKQMRGRLGTATAENVTPYITAKLDPLLSDPRMRDVFTPDADEADDSHRPSYSVVRAIEAGRIVLLGAPVGTLGLVGARTLGTIFVERVTTLVGRRSVRSGPPVAVYVDEWHRVAQTPIARLLAEGRKFGFELTLANQSLAQLRSPAAVAANVGTLAAFRLGPFEADVLASEYGGVSAESLRALPPHWAVVRSAGGDEVVGPTPGPGSVPAGHPSSGSSLSDVGDPLPDPERLSTSGPNRRGARGMSA